MLDPHVIPSIEGKSRENVRDAGLGLIGFIVFRSDLGLTERYGAETAWVSACHVTVKYRPKWPL
jgi:hypothetical protein